MNAADFRAEVNSCGMTAASIAEICALLAEALEANPATAHVALAVDGVEMLTRSLSSRLLDLSDGNN